jgi:serine protease Do
MWLALALGLAAAACSGGSGDSTAAPPATEVATETTTTPPADAATTTEAAAGDMEAVRESVVQIVATGTFEDPVEGQLANVAGAGSGFIVDPSGLAITNNHVVTGAAFIEVFIGGETDPRNAVVLGVSECSDLAVIDIDGDGYPALEWFEGDIVAGLPVIAAGYPLGDPEYTLLDGIVSKEDADGETTWASVDAVIEHSADTLPGNSGGPILTEDGTVVAVNYASNDAGQSFAIAREVALPVIDRLAAGDDVDSIGVNGEAFFDGVFTGIWVYSVASGSPADLAGIQPGDLIIRLEGLDLAVDGNMSDYCDILRSHAATDQLSVEVYRPSTDEVLEGRLNGDPLTSVFSFAAELDEVAAPGDATVSGYTDYMSVSDDAGSITVEVPVEWADGSGLPWDFGDTLVGPALTASPNVGAFIAEWGTPGVFIAASRELPVSRSELLDAQQFGDSCAYLERLPYDDGLYTGEMDVWEACGPEGSDFLVITAEPAAQDFTILVQILLVTDADWDAADRIIRSFTVIDPAAG